MRVLACGALAAITAGCAGSPARGVPDPLGRSADSGEYAAFMGTGEEELSGQAFLTTKAGDVKLAAGRQVTLDPATGYARAWFRRYGTDVDRFAVPANDSLFRAARRTATANSEGRFRFTALKPGQYLVRSLVTWEAEGDSVRQGGVVAALATAGDADSPELVISRLFTADSAAMLGVELVIQEALGTRAYRSLGRVTGVACETEWEEPARQDLLLQAGRKGADAVIQAQCRKRGVDVRRGCLNRIECEGEGIVWR